MPKAYCLSSLEVLVCGIVRHYESIELITAPSSSQLKVKII